MMPSYSSLLNDNKGKSNSGTLLVIYCITAVLSVSYYFGVAWIKSGIAATIPQFLDASVEYLWVRGVLVDFLMFNTFISIWLFYREKTLLGGALTTLLFWASGSIFLGLYIALLWLKYGSMKSILLGRNA
ncbi:hypothetical protein HCU74_00395 [Spongiibacter sp. KMU-166]|uniref:DUF1475 domain-containing protein n=1 Tax=Spongiibacter thalassae TaxID=2721624 RepID=A0ABX1G9N0_9GAMM|nr:hypothetical protein [Spongiibacter thalassae]NKI15865.1 hypothetical protein [Spongiibacter thalassae]